LNLPNLRSDNKTCPPVGPPVASAHCDDAALGMARQFLGGTGSGNGERMPDLALNITDHGSPEQDGQSPAIEKDDLRLSWPMTLLALIVVTLVSFSDLKGLLSVCI
jgi:hypothetical protein